MKKCTACKIEKTLSDFYKNKQQSSGLSCVCKDCHKNQMAALRVKKMLDPEWREKEMHRQRIKNRKQSHNNTLSSKKAREWSLRNPLKIKAHQAVSNAVRRGKLIPMECEICGSKSTNAHHEDYSKPLEVNWLCRTHHGERHVEIRRLERMKNLQITEK